jgi:nicotinamide-nucleotide amidase
MKVALIATGSELVNGRIHESNNYYISRQLLSIGLPVIAHYVVGDDSALLRSVIEHAMYSADIIIITGGLGPTVDDITCETLQSMFHLNLTVHKPSQERMERFFEAMGKSALDTDVKMVTVPENAYVFANENGLAPGFVISHGNNDIIVLPGVPHELQSMMMSVIEYCKKKYQLQKKEELTFKVIMMREAEVDSAVKEIVNKQENIDIAITYESGTTTVILSPKSGYVLPAVDIIDKIKKRFGSKLIFGFNSLEEKVVHLLAKNKLTVAIAESCTGGLVSKRITDIPGASSMFAGGVVAYSNEAKTMLLGVKEDTLNRFGAVSKETALEMAWGVKKRFNTDFGIATTGIAGPDGGTKEKPVGLVCFGIAGRDDFSTQIRFSGNREHVRTLAANYILNTLLTFAGIE